MTPRGEEKDFQTKVDNPIIMVEGEERDINEQEVVEVKVVPVIQDQRQKKSTMSFLQKYGHFMAECWNKDKQVKFE